MALTMSNYDALLKDMYEGAVREQLNNEVPLFKLLEESDRPVSGRRAVYPAHTTRNSGVGSRAENTTLPSAGQQGHSLVVVTATYFYARGRISGQAIAAGKHAFAEALSNEMDGVVKDAKVDLGRQCWGTGDGRLAQIGVSATVDASQILVFNRFAEPSQPGGRYINQNMNIELGTVADSDARGGPVIVTAIQISSVPATTTDTLVTSGSFAILSACTDYVFNEGAGGVGIEMLGLEAIVDVFSTDNRWNTTAFASATLLGIDRSTVDRWNAIVLENSGTSRIIDGNLVQQMFDEIHIESGMEPSLIMGHHSVVRAFLDSVASDRRYQTSKFDSGMSALSYNGVQLERDRSAPYNTLFVGVKETLKKFTLKPISFADKDGAILSRVSDLDMWEFWLCHYGNLTVDGPMKSLGMIRDIRTDL